MKYLKKLYNLKINLKGIDKFKYLILVFFFASVVGFIYEEIFYTAVGEMHKWGNRGFLSGTYAPIYGFGSIIIVSLFLKYKDNPFLIFSLSFIVTGVFEVFCGHFLELVFNLELWNYSGLFLSLGKYVCFRSAVTFGLGALLLVYILEPLIKLIVKKSPKLVTMLVCIFIVVLMLIDLIITRIV